MYGRHDAQQLLAAEGETEVRAEELVRRAEEDVDAERGDVDRPVRRVVDGVRPGERPGRVRELDDPRRVRHRPEGVRGEREGDDAGPVGQLSLEIVEVEGRVVVDLDEADREVEVVGELEPRRDVAVVVEARDEDLVAAPRASVRARA